MEKLETLKSIADIGRALALLKKQIDEKNSKEMSVLSITIDSNVSILMVGKGVKDLMHETHRLRCEEDHSTVVYYELKIDDVIFRTNESIYDSDAGVWF